MCEKTYYISFKSLVYYSVFSDLVYHGEHKKPTVILSKLRWTYGGELGIRTLGTLRTQHFEFYGLMAV